MRRRGRSPTTRGPPSDARSRRTLEQRARVAPIACQRRHDRGQDDREWDDDVARLVEHGPLPLPGACRTGARYQFPRLERFGVGMEPYNPKKTALSQVVGASDLGLRRPKMLQGLQPSAPTGAQASDQPQTVRPFSNCARWCIAYVWQPPAPLGRKSVLSARHRRSLPGRPRRSLPVRGRTASFDRRMHRHRPSRALRQSGRARRRRSASSLPAPERRRSDRGPPVQGMIELHPQIIGRPIVPGAPLQEEPPT